MCGRQNADQEYWAPLSYRTEERFDRICHSTFWNAAVASTGAIPPAQPLPTCRLGRGQSGARPRSSRKATQLGYPQHCGNSSLSLSLPIGVPTQLLCGLSAGALRFAPFLQITVGPFGFFTQSLAVLYCGHLEVRGSLGAFSEHRASAAQDWWAAVRPDRLVQNCPKAYRESDHL